MIVKGVKDMESELAVLYGYYRPKFSPQLVTRRTVDRENC